MLDWLLFGFGAVIVLALVLWAVHLLSMRTGFQPVLKRIRRLNRAFWNPIAMKTAGSSGATYSVVRHVGRRSGKVYETPVGVVDVPGGLVITLPYGDSADWVRNVLSAGAAEVVHEGATRQVERPEIVDSSSVDEHVSPRARAVNKLYGVNDFLVLHDSDRRNLISAGEVTHVE